MPVGKVLVGSGNGGESVDSGDVDVELLRGDHWDPIFIHSDPAAAADAGLDGVIASGLHTLAIYQRFAVEKLWSRVAGGAGCSMEIGFRRPVCPGATLTGQATVRSVEPRPHRGNASVIIDGEVVDDEDVVLTVVNESVLPLRAGKVA